MVNKSSVFEPLKFNCSIIVITLHIGTDRPEQQCRPRSGVAENAASVQGLYCPSSSTILDTTTGSKIDFIKFFNMYGKVLRCPNT